MNTYVWHFIVLVSCFNGLYAMDRSASKKLDTTAKKLDAFVLQASLENADLDKMQRMLSKADKLGKPALIKNDVAYTVDVIHETVQPKKYTQLHNALGAHFHEKWGQHYGVDEGDPNAPIFTDRCLTDKVCGSGLLYTVPEKDIPGAYVNYNLRIYSTKKDIDTYRKNLQRK